MDNYIMIYEFGNFEFTKQVNIHINLGYKPLGAPFIKPADKYSDMKFCQALIYQR